jgi:ABC-2 type transport system ATP-binding protein/lipopolysaccharide transport system ATP-binding protein
MTFINLENVTVDFTIYGANKSFRTELLQRATGGFIRRVEGRKPRVTIRALDSINLNLEHGDRLALVGHNGAGKSTLLKIFAGIYEPTAGRISSEGRISPLFNLAPGWDPEDSGYENITNCGLYFGMSADEIRAKTPEIAEVSGLGSYLDLPTRTYSAGMITRLAFAIATSIDPGILILDEGLSAGDASFAAVAKDRIDKLLMRSSILIMASHSLGMLKDWCNKGILLEHGQIVHSGPVADVCEVYMQRPKESLGSAQVVAA